MKVPLGMLLCGLVLLLTMVQMSTTLRPLVGRSPHFISPEKKFFLTHWADTADTDVRDGGGAQGQAK